MMGTQAVVWGTLVAELGKLVAWGIHLQSYSYLKWNTLLNRQASHTYPRLRLGMCAN